MRKYRASRFKQLIFPQELIIDKYHVLSRKRHFPAFWRVTEESIPLSKLASIQLHRGLFFSKIIIENSGGPYPIVLDGLWNRTAHEARDLLEVIEREMQKREDVAGIVGEGGGATGGRPGGSGPDRGGTHPSPPAAGKEDVHVSSGYHPRRPEDKAQIERIARDIVEERPESEHDGTSPMAAHYEAVRAMKESIEPPSTACPQQQPTGGRRLGEIPDNWSPAPPWAPKIREKHIPDEEPGYREVDPVEFLTREPEARVAVQESPARRSNALSKLVDWWKEAADDIRQDSSSARRRKRKPE